MFPGLLRSCRKKSRLLKAYKRTGTIVNRIKYTKYRNTLKNAIRQAEKNHYQQEFRQRIGDPRKTWQLINSLISKSKKDTSPTSLLINSEMTSDKKTIADAYNKFFVEMGPTLANRLTIHSDDKMPKVMKPIKYSIYLKPTYEGDIYKIIHQLKKSQAVGVDQIPTSAIREVSHELAPVLSNLINLSLTKGSFPDALKVAKVIPIYKESPVGSGN